MIPKEPKQKNPFVRILLVVAGIVSLGLGLLGVTIPVLPTTPFLLLSAYLFLNSSPKLYAWLLNHKWFGSYIKNYIEYRAVERKVKVITLTILWATILLSIYLVSGKWWLQILLFFIAVGVTIHVVMLKTISRKSGRMKWMEENEEDKEKPEDPFTKKSAV